MSRVRATTNGVIIGSDAPPPSTLAAKIVQNQTAQTSAPQDGGEQATFAQLLHEILYNQATVQETDVRVNVQLISVVAEAGFAPLAGSDANPFDDWIRVLEEANDSIHVIRTTIARQPEVLTKSVTEDGPLLVLILLSRMLTVCGRPRCASLRLRDLFTTIVQALDQSLDAWTLASTVTQVIMDCAEEALTAISAASEEDAATFSVNLPPARSVAQLFPQSESAIALPQGCQTTITSRAQAFMLVLELSRLQFLAPAWQNDMHYQLQHDLPSLRAKLEATNQWNCAVKALFETRENESLVEMFILEACKSIPAVDLQQLVAKILFDSLQKADGATATIILAALQSLTCSQLFNELHVDLRIAAVAWVNYFLPVAEISEQARSIIDDLRNDNLMSDGDLHTAFKKLKTSSAPRQSHVERRRRRPAISENSENPPIPAKDRVAALLPPGDLSDLVLHAKNSYPDLTETQRKELWRLLFQLARSEPALVCEIITNLLKVSEAHRSKEARVRAMLTMNELMQDSRDLERLDIAKSDVGQLTLSSLHSSIRELRIAASRGLPAFLHHGLPDKLKRENRRVVLEYLRHLSDRDIANEQETLIGAWGQVALACGSQELDLVLLRLVDYLGHTNSLICSLAFAELEKISTARGESLTKLTTPFRGHIALSVVHDLQKRPQKAQQLCDLLQITVDEFLVRTQQDTLPTLVLGRKKELLQRLAAARGGNSTIQDLCLQPKTNLAAVLAVLLMQPAADIEQAVMSCLADVAPGFNSTQLGALVKSESTFIACEMLKQCGRTPPDRKSKAFKAFSSFASIAEEGKTTNVKGAKASKTLMAFFASHLLGIMTHFSGILDTTQGSQITTPEKLDCLHAINDMITLTRQQVGIALPQVRACLQSSFQQQELIEAAFSAWLNILSVADDEVLDHLLDQTFAIIVRYWKEISPDLQNATHEQIAMLLKDHQQMVQAHIMTLPSLAGIQLLSKYASEIDRLKSHESVESHCRAFAKRLHDENQMVVEQALKELVPFLKSNQRAIHEAAVGEQNPDHLSQLIRSLLDVTTRLAGLDAKISDTCAHALGIIGCVDPNRVDATRQKRQVLVLSNFDRASEVIDWVAAFFEDVLVKAFKSVTNARAQGFLSYVMQELLRFCNFDEPGSLRPRDTQAPTAQQRWIQMPEHIRLTLTPFLTSRYVVTSVANNPEKRQYPGFSPESSHGSWLRLLVFDLMFKANGDNAKMVFPLLARIVRNHDLAIPNFLLPYAILNVVLGGTVDEVRGLSQEMLAILECQPTNNAQLETIRQCSESVFTALDYISTWLLEKKKALSESRAVAYRTGQSSDEFDELKDMAQIKEAEKFLASIPPEAIAQRAAECGSYARALFHWEQYIRQSRSIIPSVQLSADDSELFGRLHSIYANIDEPDGLEGIGAHMSFLTEEQKVVQDTKAGRWKSAQAWYEIRLAENPSDTAVQTSLLDCLRETGQYTAVLRFADSFLAQGGEVSSLTVPHALEAAWMTCELGDLRPRLDKVNVSDTHDFNVGVAKLLVAESAEVFDELLERMRRDITESMTESSTSSLQTCHDALRKLHTLYELQWVTHCRPEDVENFMAVTEKRLDALGSYTQDKQSILGLRRAAMIIFCDTFKREQLGQFWVNTARLARKANNTNSAYNAVLQASTCGDRGAKLEEAKLLWHEGHQRQAIQSLEAAIKAGVFGKLDESIGPVGTADGLNSAVQAVGPGTVTGTGPFGRMPKNLVLSAKAHILLAKWIDASGQSQAKEMTERYQHAARHFQRWEKGHYYLGKHYNRLLETEKALPKARQSTAFLAGEMTRVTIENMLRSIPFGNKYWHETIPKILTLWLDLGMETLSKARNEDAQIWERRVRVLSTVNKQVHKYFERVPAYVYYPALSQLVSRITHPHPDVWKILCLVLTRITAHHPSQALWTILALTKSQDPARIARGNEVLSKLKDPKSKHRPDMTAMDLRNMILQGQKLSEGLLVACEHTVDKHKTHVRLHEDLGFKLSLAPCPLVVPIESTLTINFASGADSARIRTHKAFALGYDKITIASFSNDVLVLNSLQRPRKITIRGSDGKEYSLLCKPKDDLRKDQRLMEFNGIINRALKRDSESSKRRLYIKTYAVTPLSEESGTIEWVEGIKPMRDILLSLYARKGVRPNYTEIKNNLNEACSSPERAHILHEKVLSLFPASLHEWFTETYSEPEVWFAARLRYARTAAVMSVTGHTLGLGDRHGENILLEEGTGGVFHVDFNCLFDKGLTFEKPELVPFRLTHNMVDAMGPYGYEGPFRRSCEITMGLLRRNKDTLMTVLETFLYDPTTDFVGKKKRNLRGVPDTPKEILESVERKLTGFLKEENMPLSVEGYVDALIREAVSPFNLASMYIGWCCFL